MFVGKRKKKGNIEKLAAGGAPVGQQQVEFWPGNSPTSSRPSRGRPTSSAAYSDVEPLRARSRVGSAVSAKAARCGSLPEPPSRRPSRCPSGAAPPAPPPQPRHGPPRARAAALPQGGPTLPSAARPSLRPEELGLSHAPRAAPSRCRAPPSAPASGRAGNPRPRALPRAGLTAHVGPGRAGPRWRLLPARHGTARHGRGGGRGAGSGARCPLRPAGRRLCPAERSRSAIASFFYDHRFSPPVSSRAFSRGFSVNLHN